jgi:SAM-dependent methyltransferase
MYPVPVRGDTGKYALATGESAANRLGILHDLYGPGTRRVLLESGLGAGMSVADLGCGVGTVTALLAELVGPEGQVDGIDPSGAQLAQARRRLNCGTNIRFVKASATDTGLPPGSFDLVYCRFLLIHFPEPERALREMFNLLPARDRLPASSPHGSRPFPGRAWRHFRPGAPGAAKKTSWP